MYTCANIIDSTATQHSKSMGKIDTHGNELKQKHTYETTKNKKPKTKKKRNWNVKTNIQWMEFWDQLEHARYTYWAIFQMSSLFLLCTRMSGSNCGRWMAENVQSMCKWAKHHFRFDRENFLDRQFVLMSYQVQILSNELYVKYTHFVESTE